MENLHCRLLADLILDIESKHVLRILHGKNGFAEVSKNLGKYRSENNFVWTIKIIM